MQFDVNWPSVAIGAAFGLGAGLTLAGWAIDAIMALLAKPDAAELRQRAAGERLASILRLRAQAGL